MTQKQEVIPYSPIRKTQDFVFISGQIGVNPQTGNFVSENITDQATQVLTNIKSLLQNEGLDFSSVIKTTVFLININHYTQMNQVYGAFFTSPFPARSAVCVSALPKGALIEIEALAVRN